MSQKKHLSQLIREIRCLVVVLFTVDTKRLWRGNASALCDKHCFQGLVITVRLYLFDSMDHVLAGDNL